MPHRTSCVPALQLGAKRLGRACMSSLSQVRVKSQRPNPPNVCTRNTCRYRSACLLLETTCVVHRAVLLTASRSVGAPAARASGVLRAAAERITDDLQSSTYRAGASRLLSPCVTVTCRVCTRAQNRQSMAAFNCTHCTVQGAAMSALGQGRYVQHRLAALLLQTEET